MNSELIPILYEDDDILVINKPAGLMVHSDGRTKEPTLTDWILEKYPASVNVGDLPITLNAIRYTLNPAINRPGIVHRLDKETSGALLIAKTQKAFEYLKKKFQSREIAKVYHLFVWGEIKDEEGEIDRPIGKSRSDFRKWSAQRGAKGEMREALTRYKVLGRKNGISLVEAYPKTGRTHQIRVHFKAINHPVVGDSLYAPKRGFALGFSRLALHARSLSFENLNGKVVTVAADYPEDFKTAVGNFNQKNTAV